MSDAKTQHAVALTSFTDSGEGTSHSQDDVILDMDAGRFANYEHAGLVRPAKDDEVKKAKAAAKTETPAA